MILIVILFPSPRERKYYKDRCLWLTLFLDHYLSSLAKSVCLNRHTVEEIAVQRKYQNFHSASVMGMEPRMAGEFCIPQTSKMLLF